MEEQTFGGKFSNVFEIHPRSSVAHTPSIMGNPDRRLPNDFLLSILYSSNKPPLYLNLLTKLRLLVNACSSFRFIFLINCKRLCHHNIKSRKILKNKGNQIIKLNLFQTEIILFLLPYCSLDVTT